ncbi:hypothetical protein [Candidatus Nanohalococcus occultus]|uniref:Uncharacterized protein n=1 Tax=Candidatus Nanohalococcus occultus TaxID=2978047 RepID=A0ABY8CI90_9ARCH|nr:hypothetical protein SVXNc_0074 [Candidatus Nanohaloarchaeota archaeon SVXNc]
MKPEEAALLTYDTNSSEFDSVYERNKFYRGLFGYKQTVTKNGKEYNYEKDGLMDEISCIRIDDSVFIFGKKNQEKVEEYFSSWGEKVTHRIFTVIVEDPELIEKLKN